MGFLTVDRYCSAAFACAGVFVAAGLTQAIAAAAALANTICSSAKPFQMCLKTDGVESGPTGTAGMETHPATAGTTGFSISKCNYCEMKLMIKKLIFFSLLAEIHLFV